MASDPHVDKKYSLSENDMEPEKDNHNAEDYIVPDGGWGWVVAFACFVVYSILDGITVSFGVIYVELLHYFNESGGKTAIAGALLHGITYLATPFICALISHFGYHIVGVIGSFLTSVAYTFISLSPNVDVLTALLGTFGAMGMQMCLVSAILCLPHYFDKKRGLAMGLAMSGSGFGTLVVPPLVEFLLEMYTWRGTCIILGGICLNLIPCSLVFRPLEKKSVVQEQEALLNNESRISEGMRDLVQKTNKDKLHSGDPTVSQNILSTTNNNEEERKNLKNRFFTLMKSTVDTSLFANEGYTLYAVSNFLLCFVFGIPYVYIPHLAQLSGIGEQEASFLISIIGITTLSQLVFGLIGDKSRAYTEMYIASMVGAGGAVLAMPYFGGDYAVLSILCVGFGIGVSAVCVLPTLMLIDLIGLEKLNVGFGMIQLLQGVAGLCGTPIGGCVFDATGSYYWAFISAGICIMISGVVLIPVPFLLRNKHSCNTQSQSDAVLEA